MEPSQSAQSNRPEHASGKSARGMVLLALILVVSALLGGHFGASVSATAAGSDDLQDSVKIFTRVLAVVERNYADPVDADKVINEINEVAKHEN